MTGCPLLVADRVADTAAWYADVLGGTNVHPGDEFAMIMLDAQLVVMLHHRDVDEHPALVVPDDSVPGVGILLYFWVDDVDAAFERAVSCGSDVLDEPHLNPAAGAREFSLRDPNGYALTISARREKD